MEQSREKRGVVVAMNDTGMRSSTMEMPRPTSHGSQTQNGAFPNFDLRPFTRSMERGCECDREQDDCVDDLVRAHYVRSVVATILLEDLS